MAIVCIVNCGCEPWPTATVAPASTADEFQEITIPIPHLEIGQNITEIVVHVQHEDEGNDNDSVRIKDFIVKIAF